MTATATLDPPRALAASASRPGMLKLTAVELRKMVDTRAGFWLPLVIAAITAITVVVSALTGKAAHHTWAHLFHNSVAPNAILLPVMGILLVCGEWTQRTTLTTFTLTPSRSRVVGAKLAASVALSIAALLVCLAFSALGAALLSDAPGGAGGLQLAIVGQSFVDLATAMVMGAAFGAAILVTAPAIVAYLLLPTLWNALAGNIHALASAARWLDSGRTLDPLSSQTLSAAGWAHAATTLAVWMALPLAVGWWRILHRDVN